MNMYPRSGPIHVVGVEMFYFMCEDAAAKSSHEVTGFILWGP